MNLFKANLQLHGNAPNKLGLKYCTSDIEIPFYNLQKISNQSF